MDTDIQLISLNKEAFTKERERNDFGTVGLFAYEKRYNFEYYVQLAKFRKKRSVEETIEFIELQCFELVASGIIKNLENQSLKIKFLEENLFERITPTLEAQMNEIMNTVLPIDTIVTPESLTFVFDVQEPEEPEIVQEIAPVMAYTTLETNTTTTHVEGITYA